MNRNDSSDAPYLDMPNGQNPEPHAKIFYGSTPEKHPTNARAKMVDHAEVMKQVMDA